MEKVKEAYVHFVNRDSFLRKVIIHMVNQRIHEFSDPLTSTLVLLASSSLQMVLCESGLIPFKSSLLPIVPYQLLTHKEKGKLHRWVLEISEEQLLETCESSGQFTLSILGIKNCFVCKQRLLMNFVHVMHFHNNTFYDKSICNTLCYIILQRFMAIVPISSEITTSIMHLLHQSKPTEICPLLTQCSGLHFEKLPTQEGGDGHKKKTKHHSAKK